MGEQWSFLLDISGVFPTDIRSGLFFALNIPTGWKLDPELDGRRTNFSWLFCSIMSVFSRLALPGEAGVLLIGSGRHAFSVKSMFIIGEKRCWGNALFSIIPSSSVWLSVSLSETCSLQFKSISPHSSSLPKKIFEISI